MEVVTETDKVDKTRTDMAKKRKKGNSNLYDAFSALPLKAEAKVCESFVICKFFTVLSELFLYSVPSMYCVIRSHNLRHRLRHITDTAINYLAGNLQLRWQMQCDVSVCVALSRRISIFHVRTGGMGATERFMLLAYQLSVNCLIKRLKK
jgi:hypothetical protein